MGNRTCENEDVVMANENGTARLDRMERMLEMLIADHVRFQEEHDRFQQEHRQLLTAQVVLTDRIDRLTITVAQLAEQQKATDERLNALISVVDDIVRRKQ